MARKPAFGRRNPGLGKAANSAGDLMDPDTDHMVRAYADTQTYARELTARERHERHRTRRGGLMVGAVALLALTLAWPFLGIDLGREKSFAVAALDQLTPEQLADLAPAAGGSDRSFLSTLLDSLRN